MAGLLPILVNAGLAGFLLGSWWWSLVLLALFFTSLPGRHWRARLDHHLRLDGALLAGRWQWWPGPGQWRNQQIQWGVCGMLILACLLFPALKGGPLVLGPRPTLPPSINIGSDPGNRGTEQAAKSNQSQVVQQRQNATGNQTEEVELTNASDAGAGSPDTTQNDRRWSNMRWLVRRPGSIGY